MNHQSDRTAPADKPAVIMVIEEADAVLGHLRSGPRVDPASLVRAGKSYNVHGARKSFLLNARGLASQRQFVETDAGFAGHTAMTALPGADDLAGPRRITPADPDLYRPDLCAALDEVADDDEVWIIGDDLGHLLLMPDRPPVTIGAVVGDLHQLLAHAAKEAAARREHAAELDAHHVSLSGRAGVDTEPVHGVPALPLLPAHQVHVLFRATLLRDATPTDMAHITKITERCCGVVLRPLLPPRDSSAARTAETTDWWTVTNKAGDELARVDGETINDAKINASRYPRVSAALSLEGGAYYRRLHADELGPEETSDTAPDQQSSS